MKHSALLLLIAALAVASCTSTGSFSDAPFTEQQFEASKAANLKQTELPGNREYVRSLSKIWFQSGLSLVNGCQQLSSRAVELYLTIDEKGIVKEVVAKPWNKMASCYASSYIGLRLPLPPVSLYYAKLMMGG